MSGSKTQAFSKEESFLEDYPPELGKIVGSKIAIPTEKAQKELSKLGINLLVGATAKKDFIILHNDFRADIKTGDDLSDIPEIYYQNLKTENVI